MAVLNKVYTYTFMNVEYKVQVEIAKYSNERPALIVKEVGDLEEPIEWTATSNLVNEDIANEFVAVKNYSENEGMYKFLTNNHIVAPSVRVVRSGYCLFPICKLLVRK